MGRHNQNQKRKNSSDGASNKAKSQKNGGPGGDIVDSGDLCDDVSRTIRLASSVLLDNSIGVLDNSVFDSAAVSTDKQAESVRDGTLSTRSGELSDAILPTNADIMKAIERMNGQINTRMNSMDKKLEKLDILEKKVSAFESDFKKLWTAVHENRKDTEASVLKVTERADTLEYSLGVVSDDITRLRSENDRLHETMTYMQSQSMRSNLLFSNIPEDVSERPEATETKLRGFLVEKMKLAQDYVDRLQFERVHRTGGRTQAQGRRGSAHRNIVAKFAFFKDRETVRRAGPQLKGTDCFVFEQFPKEVAEKRKRLVPKMNAARRNGKQAWISYDTLYIDGRPQKDAAQ